MNFKSSSPAFLSTGGKLFGAFERTQIHTSMKIKTPYDGATQRNHHKINHFTFQQQFILKAQPPATYENHQKSTLTYASLGSVSFHIQP